MASHPLFDAVCTSLRIILYVYVQGHSYKSERHDDVYVQTVCVLSVGQLQLQVVRKIKKKNTKDKRRKIRRRLRWRVGIACLSYSLDAWAVSQLSRRREYTRAGPEARLPQDAIIHEVYLYRFLRGSSFNLPGTGASRAPKRIRVYSGHAFFSCVIDINHPKK